MVFSFGAKAQYSVSSPDMTAWVNLKTDKRRGFNSKVLRPKKVRIDIAVKGKSIVHNREIGLVVFSDGKRSSFGKSDMVDCSYTTKTISDKDEKEFSDAGLQGKYYGMVLQSTANIILEIVVFNNGMAYRFSTNGFADDYEYKILNLTNVFPNDKANGILGTFTGDTVLPWHIMLFDDKETNENLIDKWQDLYPSNKVVSWKDALSSVSVGLTTNWIAGKRWGGVSASQGVYADFIYKHLYGGISYTPCYEIQYVHYEHDFDPFLNVIGGIHSWDISGRFGFNIPIQNGYDFWNITPYVTATYLALLQHGETRVGYQEVQNKRHSLVGAGLKLQYQIRQRINMGVGYEFQLFTGRKEPTGRSTFIVTMGFGL